MITDTTTMIGFSTRTLKNLLFIFDARQHGADVHIITHLIVSLVGLIVFPYEFLSQNHSQRIQTPYEELTQRGWPIWEIGLGEITTLDGLIGHLRNSCTHNRIEFSSNSRQLSEVDIIFSDRPNNNEPDNWRAKINAQDFTTFVVNFSKLLGAQVPSAR